MNSLFSSLRNNKIAMFAIVGSIFSVVIFVIAFKLGIIGKKKEEVVIPTSPINAVVTPQQDPQAIAPNNMQNALEQQKIEAAKDNSIKQEITGIVEKNETKQEEVLLSVKDENKKSGLSGNNNNNNDDMLKAQEEERKRQEALDKKRLAEEEKKRAEEEKKRLELEAKQAAIAKKNVILEVINGGKVTTNESKTIKRKETIISTNNTVLANANTNTNTNNVSTNMQVMPPKLILNIRPGSSFRGRLTNPINSKTPNLKPMIVINHPQLSKYNFDGEITTLSDEGVGITVTRAIDEQGNKYQVQGVALTTKNGELSPKFVDNIDRKILKTLGWGTLAAAVNGLNSVLQAAATPVAGATSTTNVPTYLMPVGETNGSMNTIQQYNTTSTPSASKINYGATFAVGAVQPLTTMLNNTIAKNLESASTEITANPQDVIVLFY